MATRISLGNNRKKLAGTHPGTVNNAIHSGEPTFHRHGIWMSGNTFLHPTLCDLRVKERVRANGDRVYEFKYEYHAFEARTSWSFGRLQTTNIVSLPLLSYEDAFGRLRLFYKRNPPNYNP